MPHAKYILRDLSRSRCQAAVFILCVVLAIVTLVAVNGFSGSVTTALMQDARTLHAADIIVQSRQAISPGLDNASQDGTRGKDSKLPYIRVLLGGPSGRRQRNAAVEHKGGLGRVSALRALRIGIRKAICRHAHRPERLSSNGSFWKGWGCASVINWISVGPD